MNIHDSFAEFGVYATLRDFDAYEKYFSGAKLALSIIFSLLTLDMQTNDLTDKKLVDPSIRFFEVMLA